MIALRVLGSFDLTDDQNNPISAVIAQPKRAALLAYLALARPKGMQRRDTILAFFWPDSTEDRARNSLNQALSVLRRLLPGVVVTRGVDEVGVDRGTLTFDVAEFEAALSSGKQCDALELYRGDLLPGFHLSEAPEFEQWLAGERQRLRAEAAGAAVELCKNALALQDFDAARKWVSRATSLAPESEQVLRLTLEVLDRVGDRAAAIRAYQDFAQLLRLEYQSEPSPETRAVMEKIKARKTVSTARSATIDGSGHELGAITAPPNGGFVAAQTAMAPGRSARPNARMRGFAGLGFLLVVALAVIAVVVRNERKPRKLSSAGTRIVVIPFQNQTGDSSIDALGLLAADWIADGLARTQLVPVVDSKTVLESFYRRRDELLHKPNTVGDMIDATAATTVVDGSYYRRGDSIEFDARITDGKTARILGSIQPVVVAATRAGDGIEITRQKILSLAAKLFDPRLSQVVMPDASPPSFDAYKEFVTGVDMWARQSEDMHETEVELNEVRSHFRRAYGLDTTFFTPLTWLPFTYGDVSEAKPLLDSLYERRDRLTPLDQHAVDYFRAQLADKVLASIAAAEAASDLAPTSHWSWNAGRLLFGLNRPHEALRYLERLDPDHGWMQAGWEQYWYAVAQAKHQVGDLAGARIWVERARKKFPHNVSIAAAYARALALNNEPDSVPGLINELLHSGHEWRVFYPYSVLADLRRHGREREARAIYAQVVPWYQAQGSKTTEADRREFGRILFEMNMQREAAAQFTNLASDFPKSGWRVLFNGYLGEIAAMRGDSTTAWQLLNSLPQDQRSHDEILYWKARVAARLLEKAKAVSLLRDSFAEGHIQLSLSHSMWYDFPTLQGYPPFEQLVVSR